MRARVFGVCLLVSALPVGAECLKERSIDAGVVFRRADGREGTAQRKAGAVVIDYASEQGPWTDEREAALGIYETRVTQYFQDDPDAVGGGDTETTRRFQGTQPDPVPGAGWIGKVMSKTWQNNSSEAGGYAYQDNLQATYAFLPEKSVTLSGCTYRAVPVEAGFVGRESFSQRWLYFPQLGFGLETRRDGKDNGLTMLKTR